MGHETLCPLSNDDVIKVWHSSNHGNYRGRDIYLSCWYKFFSKKLLPKVIKMAPSKPQIENLKLVLLLLITRDSHQFNFYIYLYFIGLYLMFISHLDQSQFSLKVTCRFLSARNQSGPKWLVWKSLNPKIRIIQKPSPPLFKCIYLNNVKYIHNSLRGKCSTKGANNFPAISY